MADFSPPSYKPGDPWKAADVQAIVGELKRLGNVRGGPGIQTHKGAGGVQMTAIAPNNRYLGVATSDIAARSGITPGTGGVDLQWIDDSVPTIATLGIAVVAYNSSSTTMTSGNGIDSGMYCWVEQDAFGIWHVSPLECS